jgi:hypothetical protein
MTVQKPLSAAEERSSRHRAELLERIARAPTRDYGAEWRAMDEAMRDPNWWGNKPSDSETDEVT